MILTLIELENVLGKLPDADREMLLLLFRVEMPEDWRWPWPPRVSQIGEYIGYKYEGRPLSEAAVRYRKKVLLESMQGTRVPLRRRIRGSNE